MDFDLQLGHFEQPRQQLARRAMQVDGEMRQGIEDGDLIGRRAARFGIVLLIQRGKRREHRLPLTV
ncbi:hypothetical protein LFM09_47105 [Lentzea alba]|uniref:hypothetical protein n=1 Tax=Lentzea alba TaxID=2714351 RepID=UPI0039BFA8E6